MKRPEAAEENIILPVTLSSMTDLVVDQTVWGAISSTGNGTMAAIWCWDESFGPHRPYNGAVGIGFLLLHDNAWPHVVRVCRQFLGG